MIEQSKRQNEWHPELAWLEEVNEVQVIECHITEKGSFVISKESVEELKRNIQGR